MLAYKAQLHKQPGHMQPLLVLPPLAPQVTYRPYDAAFLKWARERFESMPETRGFHALYFVDEDAALLAASGITGFQAFGTVREGIADYARVFGTAGVRVFPLEDVVKPDAIRCGVRFEDQRDALRMEQMISMPTDLKGTKYLDAWMASAAGSYPVPLPSVVAPSRILFLTPAASYTGAEASLSQMIGALPMERHAVVGAEGFFAQKLREANCPVFTPNRNLFKDGDEERRWALDILDLYAPSVVHSNSFPGKALLAALRSRGIPWVQHVRTADFEVLREPLAYATAVIAISAFIEQLLIASGVDARKIHRIHNGVDLDYLNPERFDRDDVRRELGLPLEARVVLMVARCTPMKRFELLVETASPATHLCLVTDEEDPAYARSLREQCSANVSWLPFQPDIAAVYAAADVLVLPSDREGLGRCVMEAMAMQCPVIVSDNGGCVELVRHGIDGLHFRAGSARALAAAIAEVGRKPCLSARQRIVEEFSIEACAQKTHELFLSLMRD